MGQCAHRHEGTLKEDSCATDGTARKRREMLDRAQLTLHKSTVGKLPDKGGF